MFNVDEIVVYKVPENAKESVAQSEVQIDKPKKIKLDEVEDKASASTHVSKENNSDLDDLKSTANMLQYFITPVHLRTLIFKGIGNPRQFKYAKNMLEIPYSEFKDSVIQGIAVPRKKPRKLPGQKKLTKKNRRDATLTKYINLGFDRLFALADDATVPVHSQVFVDLKSRKVVSEGHQAYTVRAVENFSTIFTESPLQDGYEQTVFVPSQQFKTNKQPMIQETLLRNNTSAESKQKLLLVFGKWSEVVDSVTVDPELDVDAADLFDGLHSSVPNARLEDAVMVTLARL